MFEYNKEKMGDLLLSVIRENLSMDQSNWFEAKCELSMDASTVNTTFALIPRKVGKARINLNKEKASIISSLRPGVSIADWNIDRLCRMYLLTRIDVSSRNTYFRLIENLFLAAEMNELVALYSSLPLLAYPDLWIKRCSEGIRSNIGLVLESIMYHNPYPAENLDELAWNQLVLKAFFTDKVVNYIYGLDERANAELAYILSDYAHERWAANREINPQLWRLTTKFLDDRLFNDIRKVMQKGDLVEKRAAALTAFYSDYSPAKDLLGDVPALKSEIEQSSLTWDTLNLVEFR